MTSDVSCDFFFFHFFVKLRYAYAVASALHGVRHILRKDFMLQVWMILYDPFHIHYFMNS